MPRINITLPVFNEEAQLASSARKLAAFLEGPAWRDGAGRRGDLDYEIVIADNGSTDRTLAIARELARNWPKLGVAHMEQKGRGRALKEVWGQSEADICSYMDLDLSTGLEAFPLLIDALGPGGFDLAVGTRLDRMSHTERGWRRECISRCYNRLVKWSVGTRFSDAQCGFKAVTRQAARRLLPLVEDGGWFFDTELLVVAEKCGYRICDVPVRWIDDPDTRVKVLPTAWADIRGLARLRRKLRGGAYGVLTQGSFGIRAQRSP